MTQVNVENGQMNEVEILVAATGKSRKPAFAFFNRDVVLKHVDLIFEKMKIRGFRESFPIQVFPAEESRIDNLIDINGQKIEDENFSDYFLVIDGQHRTRAAAKYNEHLKLLSNPTIKVPAVIAAMNDGETITSYLNETNVTLKEWTKEDFLCGAANVNEDIPLLQKYKELIKKPSNLKGIPLSTLNKIFCNSSGLTKQDFVLLCYGHLTKGRSKKEIIPAHDIITGEKFIELCKKAGFEEPEYAKRYLVTEFNDLIIAHDKGFAINVFDQITDNDAAAMLSKSSHLEEEKVIAQIKIVKERVLDLKAKTIEETEIPVTE